MRRGGERRREFYLSVGRGFGFGCSCWKRGLIGEVKRELGLTGQDYLLCGGGERNC